MNVETELSDRFCNAVKELIKPPVLVSPRWVRPGPAEGEYEFIGTLKIAKATGRSPLRIASQLRKLVNVEDLKLDMRTTKTGVIHLVPTRNAPRRTRKPNKPA